MNVINSGMAVAVSSTSNALREEAPLSPRDENGRRKVDYPLGRRSRSASNCMGNVKRLSLSPHAYLDILLCTSVFESVNPDRLGKALENAKIRIIQSGEKLFERGTVINSVSYIFEGGVDIVVGKKRVAHFQAGQLVGIMGLLDPTRKRSADGVAATVDEDEGDHTMVVKFNIKDFEELVRNEESLQDHLLASLYDYMRINPADEEANPNLASQPSGFGNAVAFPGYTYDGVALIYHLAVEMNSKPDPERLLQLNLRHKVYSYLSKFPEDLNLISAVKLLYVFANIKELNFAFIFLKEICEKSLKEASDPHALAIYQQAVIVNTGRKEGINLKDLQERVAQLGNCFLFKILNIEQKLYLARELQEKSYLENDLIMEEGQMGDGLYFIRSGKVELRKKQTSGENATHGMSENAVTPLTKDQCFGEISFITNRPCNANVVALTDTLVYAMVHEKFQLLRKNNPVIFESIFKSLVQNIDSSNLQLASSIKTNENKVERPLTPPPSHANKREKALLGSNQNILSKDDSLYGELRKCTRDLPAIWEFSLPDLTAIYAKMHLWFEKVLTTKPISRITAYDIIRSFFLAEKVNCNQIKINNELFLHEDKILQKCADSGDKRFDFFFSLLKVLNDQIDSKRSVESIEADTKQLLLGLKGSNDSKDIETNPELTFDFANVLRAMTNGPMAHSYYILREIYPPSAHKIRTLQGMDIEISIRSKKDFSVSIHRTFEVDGVTLPLVWELKPMSKKSKSLSDISKEISSLKFWEGSLKISESHGMKPCEDPQKYALVIKKWMEATDVTGELLSGYEEE